MMGSLGLVETQLRQYLFWAQRLGILGEKGFQLNRSEGSALNLYHTFGMKEV